MVTNHALLAIDALEDFIVLPEHDVVVIDEAHDLVDRVTAAASRELSAPGAETAARRTARILTEGQKAGDVLDQLREAAEGLGRVLTGDQPRAHGHPVRAAGDGADRAARRRYLRVPHRCAPSARKCPMMPNDWPSAAPPSPR